MNYSMPVLQLPDPCCTQQESKQNFPIFSQILQTLVFDFIHLWQWTENTCIHRLRETVAQYICACPSLSYERMIVFINSVFGKYYANLCSYQWCVPLLYKISFNHFVSLPSTGLSLVVGLVLYISNINDEMLNRTKTNEAYFSYKYGWSFAFAAISFLLTEVTSESQIVSHILQECFKATVIFNHFLSN